MNFYGTSRSREGGELEGVVVVGGSTAGGRREGGANRAGARFDRVFRFPSFPLPHELQSINVS